MNGVEKAMSVTEVGDTVTLIEVKEKTYRRVRCGLRLVSSKEIKTDIKTIRREMEMR